MSICSIWFPKIKFLIIDFFHSSSLPFSSLVLPFAVIDWLFLSSFGDSFVWNSSWWLDKNSLIIKSMKMLSNYRLQYNSLCRGTRLWHVGIEHRKRNLPDASRNVRFVPVRNIGAYYTTIKKSIQIGRKNDLFWCFIFIRLISVGTIFWCCWRNRSLKGWTKTIFFRWSCCWCRSWMTFLASTILFTVTYIFTTGRMSEKIW